MAERLNLLEETIEHFSMGARSVRAYTNATTYVITRSETDDQYTIVEEEAGFSKKKTSNLESYFGDVFGIEAKY